MDYFKNEERFKNLVEIPKDISHLLKDEMLLISGDFYGIQKFIFDRLSTKNASKVLRAKSAYIQIFTEYLARYICSELEITENAILSMNAGKFEILSSKMDIDLNAIQKRVDDFFVKNFYGLSGVVISSVECQGDDFKSTEKYKALRKKIIDSVEDRKFQKFNLFRDDAYDVLSYDTNLDNSSLCPICNIRKVGSENEHCSICDGFINLGQRLAKDSDEILSSAELGIHFIDNFNPKIKLDSRIKSYILYVEDKGVNVPADFKRLADNACSQIETGIKSLAILKADVDNMGKFLEKSDVTGSFESFDSFSKTIDNFFSLYIPTLMRKKYPNTYTVFAGGDDLFLLGAWDEILDLAREIEREFKAFVTEDAKALTISFGIAIAKPSTPISYLADHSEHLLEEAKGIDNEKEVEHPKDALSLFGETVKWSDYLEVYNHLYSSLESFEEHLNTAFLYRLLELIEMSKKVKYANDIASTMWKSKFRYSFNRNILEKMKNSNDNKRAEEMLELLGGLIDSNPKETKMVVNEFIYKRRES